MTGHGIGAAKLLTALAAIVCSAGSVALHDAAACPQQESLSLSVDDVQSLLQSWNLHRAFGKEFEQQLVDGYALQHLNRDMVVPSVYPQAQPFHWAMLWERLGACGIGASAKTAPVKSTALPPRRKLASSQTADGSGLIIKAQQSTISMGPDGDVVLQRSGERSMRINGNVHFTDNVTFSNHSVWTQLLQWQEAVTSVLSSAYGSKVLSVAGLINSTITNCNFATTDGFYWIDTGTVSNFLALCEQDNDDNWWMSIMYIVDQYTPRTIAIGDFDGETQNETFKLSDAQINAVIGTDDTFGHTYRVHGHNEWTTLDYFVMTAQAFKDTARGFGAGGSDNYYMHSEGSVPSENDWEVAHNDNLDSLGLSYIYNDGDRYFADHSATINCYPTSSTSQRCFSSGSSADDHDRVDSVTVSLHVGPLKGVSAYPDINDLDTITNCNFATGDGYYLIDTGSVDAFGAYCSFDSDGNAWMDIMFQTADYAPDFGSAGEFYNEHFGISYKLSDKQINAVINSNNTFGHTYRVHGHEEWTYLNYYIMTSELFDDEERGYGAPIDGSFYMHSEGELPSTNAWEVAYNDNPDSLGLSYIGNDEDRYFCDHSYTYNCYPEGTSTTRCWSSGSSASDHDQIDSFTMSVHVGRLANIAESEYPFPNIAGEGTVLNCNDMDKDGYYNIDTGTVDPFMAYCSRDGDGNAWMEVMYQNADYEPDFGSTGEFYNAYFGLPYKLSDKQVNSVIGTNSTFGHSYRVHGSEEWTDMNYYLMTAAAFDDTERGYGIPVDGVWYTHSEGALPSTNAWEIAYNDNPDSLGLSYISNDEDRYFCDHSYTYNCYPEGTSDTRCWSSGSSANDHDQIDAFSLAVHVGRLADIADDAYPFPDVVSKGTVPTCNNMTDDGYYTIVAGSEDPFIAFCSRDSDGNAWMDVMFQTVDYAPNNDAYGEFYGEHFGLAYKLADAQVNAVIDLGTELGHTYRVHGHNEWTELNYYMMTTGASEG